MADAEKLQEIEDDITIRPNYFAGQYLLEDDFKSEQNYHIDRQRSHNRLLHVSGIAKGLKVSTEQNLTVKVSGGTAFDSRGRQIILLKDKTVDLVKEANNNKPIKDGAYILSIRYSEENTEQQGEETFTTTRVQEKPEFVLSLSPKKNADTILLAELQIQGKAVKSIDHKNREYSGINLPNDDGKGVTLRVKSEDQNQAILEGSLRITKDLYVDGTCSIHGTGTTYISGTVHIVTSLGIGKETHGIYVNQIVNSISEDLKTDKADAKALLTVKAAVDYADTKASKNGDIKENFTAAHLTVKQLTINNKEITAISEIISESGDESKTVIPTCAAVKAYVDSSKEKDVKQEYKWNEEEKCGELEVTWEGIGNNFLVPITMRRTPKMMIIPKGLETGKIQIILVAEGRDVTVERTEKGIICKCGEDEKGKYDRTPKDYIEHVYPDLKWWSWSEWFPDLVYNLAMKGKREWQEVCDRLREMEKETTESRDQKKNEEDDGLKVAEWLALCVVAAIRKRWYYNKKISSISLIDVKYDDGHEKLVVDSTYKDVSLPTSLDAQHQLQSDQVKEVIREIREYRESAAKEEREPTKEEHDEMWSAVLLRTP
ncbi:MAG TPA: hypothetical protein VIQ31_00060 [Phormidium sp.]